MRFDLVFKPGSVQHFKLLPGSREAVREQLRFILPQIFRDSQVSLTGYGYDPDTGLLASVQVASGCETDTSLQQKSGDKLRQIVPCYPGF